MEPLRHLSQEFYSYYGPKATSAIRYLVLFESGGPMIIFFDVFCELLHVILYFI